MDNLSERPLDEMSAVELAIELQKIGVLQGGYLGIEVAVKTLRDAHDGLEKIAPNSLAWEPALTLLKISMDTLTEMARAMRDKVATEYVPVAAAIEVELAERENL